MGIPTRLTGLPGCPAHGIIGKALIVTFALFLLLGCRARAPVRLVSPIGSYRVEKINDQRLVLPPPTLSDGSTAESIQLRFRVAQQKAVRPEICSLSSGPFQFLFKKGSRDVTLRMPSVDDWANTLENWRYETGDVIQQDLEQLLRSVQDLELKGCLAAGTGVAIRNLVRESIPMRPDQGLFNSYGYRPGKSGIDLKPGTQLRIDRTYLRDTAGVMSLANYLGVGVVYYQVAEDRDRWIQLHLTSHTYSSPEVERERRQGAPDLEVAEAVGRMPLYRLFFYNLYVPARIRRVALIVGAADTGTLDRIADRLLENPSSDCPSLRQAGEISCVELAGPITATLEVNVVVNGESTYLPWGSSVKTVLVNYRGENLTKALRTLRIQRQFQGRTVDVQFTPGDQAMMDFTLVGGDRISWSLPQPAK